MISLMISSRETIRGGISTGYQYLIRLKKFFSDNLGPSILFRSLPWGSYIKTGSQAGTGNNNGHPRQGREFRCIQPSGNFGRSARMPAAAKPRTPQLISGQQYYYYYQQGIDLFRLFPAMLSYRFSVGKNEYYVGNLQNIYIKFRT